MKFILNNEIEFENPTFSVIEASFQAMGECDGDVACLEHKRGFIDCSKVADNAFLFQFLDPETFKLYVPKKGDLTISEVLGIFGKYLSLDQTWKDDFDWYLSDYQLTPEQILENK